MYVMIIIIIIIIIITVKLISQEIQRIATATRPTREFRTHVGYDPAAEFRTSFQ